MPQGSNFFTPTLVILLPSLFRQPSRVDLHPFLSIGCEQALSQALGVMGEEFAV